MEQTIVMQANSAQTCQAFFIKKDTIIKNTHKKKALKAEVRSKGALFSKTAPIAIWIAIATI